MSGNIMIFLYLSIAFFPQQIVQTLMKCRMMQHSNWVFVVCQSNILRESRTKRESKLDKSNIGFSDQDQ